MKTFKNVKSLSALLFLVLLASCQPYRHPAKFEYERYRLDGETAPGENKEMNQLIQPYKARVSSQMDEKIATVPTAMIKQRPESVLGNWMADAIDAFAEKQSGEEIDLSICNYGGVRLSEIPEGDLTVGTLYELMPFDNYVVIMTVRGAVLLKILERIADYGGWPVSRELRMTIDKEGRIVEATLNAKAITPEANYRIALSDYLANGGDDLDFLRPIARVNTHVYYRDALIEIARIEKTVTSRLEGRIKQTDNDQ